MVQHFRQVIDETLHHKITKTPKEKGEYKKQNERTHISKNKWTAQEGGPQGEHHHVPEPPLVVISISNDERGGPPKRTHSLDEPSLMTTTHIKIKTIYTHYNTIDIFCSLKCTWN